MMCYCVCVGGWAYLVLLSSTLLVVVEDVLSDVLPAVVVGRHMVDALLQPFVAPPAGVEEDAQQQHCNKDGGGSSARAPPLQIK